MPRVADKALRVTGSRQAPARDLRSICFQRRERRKMLGELRSADGRSVLHAREADGVIDNIRDGTEAVTIDIISHLLLTDDKGGVLMDIEDDAYGIIGVGVIALGTDDAVVGEVDVADPSGCCHRCHCAPHRR
jgi:hypothetical protein